MHSQQRDTLPASATQGDRKEKEMAGTSQPLQGEHSSTPGPHPVLPPWDGEGEEAGTSHTHKEETGDSRTSHLHPGLPTATVPQYEEEA